jgi:MFS family permease
MTTQQVPRAREGRDSRSGRVVDALVDRGLVSPELHDEAVDVVEHALSAHVVEPTSLRRRLAELAGYVGGALVVAAGALFVADQWMDLTVGQQVGLLAGIAVVLFGAGVAVGLIGGGFAALRADVQPVRRRLASVLFTGGAVAGAATVTVWLIDVIERRGTEMDEGTWIGVGGSLTLIVLALVGYLLAHSLLGQAAVAVGFAYAVPFTLDSLAEIEALPLGLGYLAVGLAWLALAERRVWREVVPGRIIGAVFVVVGAQIPVTSDLAWVGYLLTLLVAVAGFAMYVVRRAWPYLAVGVVGVTLAVPEALLDWTEGSLGTAGVLLVAGVTLLGASLLGLRLRQEVTESEEERV